LIREYKNDFWNFLQSLKRNDNLYIVGNMAWGIMTHIERILTVSISRINRYKMNDITDGYTIL